LLINKNLWFLINNVLFKIYFRVLKRHSVLQNAGIFKNLSLSHLNYLYYSQRRHNEVSKTPKTAYRIFEAKKNKKKLVLAVWKKKRKKKRGKKLFSSGFFRSLRKKPFMKKKRKFNEVRI